MLDLKQLISETITESTPPWVPETQYGREMQKLESIIAAQIANSDVNKNVADIRDIDDGQQKKLRDAETEHKDDAESNFDTYQKQGGDKTLDDLRMPYNPRKEWEKTHRAEWDKAHPRPKNDIHKGFTE